GIWLPVGDQLKALGVAGDAVAVNEGMHGVGIAIGCFRERRAGLQAEEVIVMVEESREIHGEFSVQQLAIPGFITNESFGCESPISAGAVKGEGVEGGDGGVGEIVFDIRGSADGAGDGAPESLFGGGGPEIGR